MAGRIISPKETWSRIEPFLARFGITRVGDITGLDHIGIPVWIAVRPNSRTLSVSQGKGIDDWSARVSATMEALEMAHAEQHRLPLQLATLEAMAAKAETVDLSKLPPVRNSLFGKNREIYWTEAIDWTSHARVFVPYEMVHADATLPWMPGSGSFLLSTNGLASGNLFSEAFLHGLYEVIERDGLALWEHSMPDERDKRSIDLSSIDHPPALALLKKFESAGITPLIWDATSDVGVPIFRAVIVDESADAVTHPFPAAFGAGCHCERGIALTRALTEAAQSRLTIIAGSRDDFGRSRYKSAQAADSLTYHRDIAQAGKGNRHFHQVPNEVHDRHEDEITSAIARLKEAGMDQVLYVDLSDPDLPISVARVIVPGLEGPTASPSYTPGNRVRALSLADAAP